VLQTKQGAGGTLNRVREMRWVQAVWTVKFSFVNYLMKSAELDFLLHEVRPSSKLKAPDSLDRLVELVMTDPLNEAPMVMAMQQNKKEISEGSHFGASVLWPEGFL
jgi:hypothetical protein